MNRSNRSTFGGFDAEELAEAHGIDIADPEKQWENDEETPLPAEGAVIKPFAWKILVLPIRRPTITKGGIMIPTTVQAVDIYLNYIGKIVALGPLAFKHAKWKTMGLTDEHTPKRGDWMIYPQYQYQRIDFKGTKLILLNDDSFLGTVPEGVSPWDFRLER